MRALGLDVARFAQTAAAAGRGRQSRRSMPRSMAAWPRSSPWPTRSSRATPAAIAALHAAGPEGRDDHRRQRAHRQRHRRHAWASTRSSPKCCPTGKVEAIERLRAEHGACRLRRRRHQRCAGAGRGRRRPRHRHRHRCRDRGGRRGADVGQPAGRARMRSRCRRRRSATSGRTCSGPLPTTPP